jgi:hypothetical protein
MYTKESMAAYINQAFDNWQTVVTNPSFTSLQTRQEKFTSFQQQYALSLDGLQNHTDKEDKFIFDQLDLETQSLFRQLCRTIEQTQNALENEFRALNRSNAQTQQTQAHGHQFFVNPDIIPGSGGSAPLITGSPTFVL